ncbi:hypothetical protein PAXRUDRAFT_163644, partial [Paxillus rubicundulus Ve08.2h10]
TMSYMAGQIVENFKTDSFIIWSEDNCEKPGTPIGESCEAPCAQLQSGGSMYISLWAIQHSPPDVCVISTYSDVFPSLLSWQESTLREVASPPPSLHIHVHLWLNDNLFFYLKH